jgi:hypothetical protein
MTKFKVGPAKTRDGKDVVIYTVDGFVPGYPIEGHLKDSDGIYTCKWSSQGRLIANSSTDFDANLLPNNLPEFVEFETVFGTSDILIVSQETVKKFKDQRVRIRIEAVGE